MKDLYLAIAILCFLVAIMVYCVNKSIQALRELHNTWKKYKKSQKEIVDFIRDNWDEIT